MQTQTSLTSELRAALERDPRVNRRRATIDIGETDDAQVLLHGEVASIEAKRAAVECARAVPGVRRVVDRLTVEPTSFPGDGAIRDSVARHLLEEPVFARAAISCRIEGDSKVIAQQIDGDENAIDATVADGIVTLRGHVLSLSHSRLATVLAWWAPGCRDVINCLEIRPPEDDNDDEITDAIRLVLDKDPLVHGDQIRAQVRDREVMLSGMVANQEERRMATQDVWYVEGVRNVIDELEVYPARAPGEAALSTLPGAE
jgi:osmotically-inducible protein OsmY